MPDARAYPRRPQRRAYARWGTDPERARRSTAWQADDDRTGNEWTAVLPFGSMLSTLIERVGRRLHPTKASAEMGYWHDRVEAEGQLRNDWYERAFTAHFGVDRSFYANRRVLDIGCGPRGSLEWCDEAAETVGLDPLADRYLKLGAEQHRMRYVEAGAERIPFEDGHFDIVSCLNSLDHVDDVDAAIREITRVTRRDGTLLLFCEIGHE